MTSKNQTNLWRLLVTMACFTLAATALAPAMTSAQEPTGAFRTGPYPIDQALAEPGPFEILSITIDNAQTPGFGTATIYYPADTSQAPFGGIVSLPGFTAARSSTAWIAEHVASHGFVVLNSNTNGSLDFPESRGTQILAAVEYLRNASPVSDLVDPLRIGVMGHSMGGGGALEAIAADPTIAAAVPLTPWNGDKTWEEVTTPTLIIGAESDTVAGVNSHSIPFYTSMTQNERAYLEINDGTHSAPTGDQVPAVAQYTVAWFKRYVDNDTRYVQFICPGPQADTLISAYQASCSPEALDGTGDANCDGVVDTDDARLVLSYAIGLTTTSATCGAIAAGTLAIEPTDVEGIGQIDSLDALTIAQCLAGKTTSIACSP